MPDFSTKPSLGADSPQRQWIAEAGALIGRVGSEKKTTLKATMIFLNQHWSFTVEQIQGLILDVVEELKLDLELSGRAEIGSAYAPGEVYKFFADLKSIVNCTKSEIFLIDPYFNGEAFDNYLPDVFPDIQVRIFANNYSKEIKVYIEKHQSQFSSNIELKKSKQLHDRLIFIDRTDCWIMGGSVKDAGNKPTYLIPIGTELANDKLKIYEEIWNNSEEIV